MIYINITNFLRTSYLEKDHSIIETGRLENVVSFIQTSFVLSRKIINIYSDIARNIEMLELKILENMKI